MQLVVVESQDDPPASLCISGIAGSVGVGGGGEPVPGATKLHRGFQKSHAQAFACGNAY